MDSNTWMTVGRTLCTIMRRVESFKYIIQCTYGKTDLFYKRFVVFMRELDSMRICLCVIMDSYNSGISIDAAFYDSSDWSTEDPVPMRPLPKEFTETQRLDFLELLNDVRAYVDGLDAYPFGYHAQLRVDRNKVLLKMNGLNV
jgi:hypothetical protein